MMIVGLTEVVAVGAAVVVVGWCWGGAVVGGQVVGLEREKVLVLGDGFGEGWRRALLRLVNSTLVLWVSKVLCLGD